MDIAAKNRLAVDPVLYAAQRPKPPGSVDKPKKSKNSLNPRRVRPALHAAE
jgi:hypothetical protein